MYLILIETSGNQNYIFSTNKLKENVGASELTYRAGTDWITQAIAAVTGNQEWNSDQSIRKKLLDQMLNRPIESCSGDVKVEIIVATSGKALLLTKDFNDAKQIIRNITQRALNESPGLDICGVISDEFNWDEEVLGKRNSQVHQQFEALRSQRSSPELRFLRLPVIESCATSGLPANKVDSHTPDKTPILRSLVSIKKRGAVKDGFKRIERLLKNHPSGLNFARSIRVLDKDREVTSEDLPDSNNNDSRTSDSLDWLSVIHADGNGLGEIFLNFEEHLKNLERADSNWNRNYINHLKKFSLALDYCTEQAFIKALDAFTPRSDLLPIVPLVLGGDDLTVVCDGKFALRFTQLFLKHFEEETQKTGREFYDGVIPKIAKEALKVGRLSACAGVAIIKPHFPFSIAYELAEALTQSAKQVKKIVQTKPVADGTQKPYPCSALDFHIVYDASGVDLDQIRQKLQLPQDRGTKLYSRPYVITSKSKLQEATGLDWVENHQWKKFEERVKLLTASNEEGVRKLPNSQMHDLRAGLMLGKDLADARYRLIRDRYLGQGIVGLESSKDSLFTEENPNSNIYITGLLDAMDAASFLVVEDPVSPETPAPVSNPEP